MKEALDSVGPYLKWLVGLATFIYCLKITLMFSKRKKKRSASARSANQACGGGASPMCPFCGGDMVKRFRKTDGKPFYGCKSYPRCKGIVNIKG